MPDSTGGVEGEVEKQGRESKDDQVVREPERRNMGRGPSHCVQNVFQYRAGVKLQRNKSMGGGRRAVRVNCRDGGPLYMLGKQ